MRPVHDRFLLPPIPSPTSVSPNASEKIVAKSPNLATATHQTSQSKPVEPPPSTLKSAFLTPRRDERPLWRMSGHPAVQQAVRNDNFELLGLPRIYAPAQA